MNTLALTTPTIESALAKVSASQADVQALTAAFAPHYQALQGLVEQAREVKADQPKKAKAVRLEIKAVRVASEKTRKTAKEDSLRRGKAIDGIHNVLEFQCVPMEEALEQIEKAEEIAEENRKNALMRDRCEQLRPYMDPTHMSLGEMTEQVFADLLNGAKAACKAKIDQEARAKAQAEAEERRRLQEEQDLREAREAENARLATVARQEREAREEIERKAAADRAIADALLAKERAAAMAAQEKAQQEAKEAAKKAQREREEQEMIANAERHKAAAALEAEKRKAEIALAEIRRLAVEQEKKDQEAAALAARAAAAPDKIKVKGLAQFLRQLQVPTLSTPAGAELMAKAKSQADKFAAWLESEAEKL